MGLWPSPKPWQWMVIAVFSPDGQEPSFRADALAPKNREAHHQARCKALVAPACFKPEMAAWGGQIIQKEIEI